MDLPPHDRERSASGVLMLPIRQAGRLREVRGQARVRAVPGIEGLTISVPRGETLVPLPEGDRYLGFLFARAATPDAVELALRTAWAALEVIVDPGGPALEQVEAALDPVDVAPDPTPAP